MSDNANKTLVFSPHEDDLDFGCAGSVALWASQGAEIAYCIVTNGEKGIRGEAPSSSEEREKIIATRKSEQESAARAVGVKEVVFLDEIDGEVENTPALRMKIVRVIRQMKPDTILSIDPANLRFNNFFRFHRDHRMTAEAVFDSIYPATGSYEFFPDLLDAGYEPHQIQELWFYGTDRPNIYIDISDTIEKKVEALFQHKSQFDDIARVGRRVREIARRVGSEGGMEYAESFRRISF